MRSRLNPATVQSQLRAAAEDARFAAVRAELHRRDVSDDFLVHTVANIDERVQTQGWLLKIRRSVLGETDPWPYLLERYALIRSAEREVDRLSDLAVPEEVAQFFLEEFTVLGAPNERQVQWFEAGTHTFAALCKLSTLRRFPAGQFHWEVSGLPRSVFLRVKGRDRARLAGAVMRLGGLQPLFVPHMPWRRKHLVLLETEQHRSYYRMARAMEQQPRVRGFLAEAWFHAPDTYEASPNLAWVNRVFQEWGGVVVKSGRARPESGVFELGKRRRQLAAEGKYTPSLGLVIWPRAAMLAWAAHYAENSGQSSE